MQIQQMPRYLHTGMAIVQFVSESNKEGLLKKITDGWRLLFKNLDKVPRDRWEEPGVIGNWSIKDILAHLHEWHQMYLGWHRDGQQGVRVKPPHPDFKWNQLDKVNDLIYDKYKDATLVDIEEMLENSHRQTLNLVENTSEEAIFSKGHFDWIGKGSLRSYITANSSGHYNWAKKHIRKWMKAQKLI